MSTRVTETALEPDLPIIDPHHHLWDWRSHLQHLRGHPLLDVVRHTPTYLMGNLMGDVARGHAVRTTVYMECGANYWPDGPEALKPAGEVHAAVAAAERHEASHGTVVRPCAGIVGFANLALGADVAKTLDAEVEAGHGRFRGVRMMAAWDADPAVLGPTGRAPQGLLLDDAFRRGFRQLQRYGLSFDAWVLEPQLPDLVDLARAFPYVPIVVNHTAAPVGIASYADSVAERFASWATSVRSLATCLNVTIKLGGLGNPVAGALQPGMCGSEALAERWRPYVEHCIEVFGSSRCMFESNFPVDRWVADYVTLWNAFKRITASASAAEKRDLYFDTAARVYSLDIKDAAAGR